LEEYPTFQNGCDNIMILVELQDVLVD